MKKTAILTMGLSGAGKSTITKMLFDTALFTVIDSDKIKEEKADYNPKRPEIYHEWSKQVAKSRKFEAISKNENLILDTTGTNVERMYKEITELQGNGYSVTILYVKVSLKTALKRNAARERNVPESIIREKSETISYAFDILSGIANEVKVINND